MQLNSRAISALVFALLSLPYALLPIPAHAADSIIVDLSADSGRNSLGATVSASPAVPAFRGGSFSLPVPGNAAELTLSEVPEKSSEISVPVFDSAGNLIRHVRTAVTHVTDYKNVSGIAARSEEGAVYGTLISGAGPDASVYQVSPVKKGAVSAASSMKLPHSIAKYSAAELKTGAASKHEDGLHFEERLAEEAPGAGATAAASSAQNVIITGWRSIELMVVAQSEFTKDRTDSEITAQIVQTIRRANVYYESLQLKIELAGVQIFRNGENDPYVEAAAEQDGQKERG